MSNLEHGCRGERGAGIARVIALLAALLTAPPVWAQNSAPAAGQPSSAAGEQLIVARNGSLWRVALPPAESRSGQPGDGADGLAPVELVRVGTRDIERIAISPATGLVLIETAEGVKWAVLPDAAGAGAPRQASAAASVACAGRAHLSPDGRCVACLDHRGNVMLHRLLPTLRTMRHAPAAGPHLGFVAANQLALSDARGIWAVSIAHPKQRSLLAPVVPSGPMVISPDGKRAAGVFDENQEPERRALYVFRLDGKGVKRRLMQDARPFGWSRDSRWIMAQAGKRACMMRAIGGQYKCWRGYRAVALAPDGSQLLMTRLVDGEDSPDADDFDLYVGDREGVRAATPRRVMQSVTGPAVWWPAR